MNEYPHSKRILYRLRTYESMFGNMFRDTEISRAIPDRIVSHAHVQFFRVRPGEIIASHFIPDIE